ARHLGREGRRCLSPVRCLPAIRDRCRGRARHSLPDGKGSHSDDVTSSDGLDDHRGWVEVPGSSVTARTPAVDLAGSRDSARVVLIRLDEAGVADGEDWYRIGYFGTSHPDSELTHVVDPGANDPAVRQCGTGLVSPAGHAHHVRVALAVAGVAEVVGV